jgi:biopolymer transport protein ExbD
MGDMAGNFHSLNDDDVISSINITPLVDVVLVLLIIFLITAPVIYQTSIKVQLPQAKSGAQNQKSPLTFTLNQEGTLYWKKEVIQWETLPQKLKSLGNGIISETAFISADAATPHGKVVRLMDELRQAGLTRFAFDVQNDPKAL